VTFAEDLSQIHTGHGPAVMATLRTPSRSGCTDEPAPTASPPPAGPSVDIPAALAMIM
jgi:hypothetical protein